MPDRYPTLADLCSAIAEGHIEATVDGTMYQVNALELRRYLNKHRSLSTITFTSSPSDPLPGSDVPDWTSNPVQTSVA
jgi:inhibitor of KinA sporulation pathway (predicted exonuclease)